MMDYISNRYYLDPENIKIQDTDRLKRLDLKHWEQYMAWKLDDAKVDLPFWVSAEGVTLQIMRQSGLQEASISPSPSPPQAPSLLPDNASSSSPSAEGDVTDSMDTSLKIEAADCLIHLPDSHETPLIEVRQNELRTTGAKEHTSEGRPGKVRKRRLKAITKCTDLRLRKDSRIIKSSWKPAMGLRSHNFTTFYELGCNGKAADHQQWFVSGSVYINLLFLTPKYASKQSKLQCMVEWRDTGLFQLKSTCQTWQKTLLPPTSILPSTSEFSAPVPTTSFLTPYSAKVGLTNLEHRARI